MVKLLHGIFYLSHDDFPAWFIDGGHLAAAEWARTAQNHRINFCRP